jgi:hypothetical protein
MCGRAIDILTEARKFGVVAERLVFKTHEARRQNKKFVRAGAIRCRIAKESRIFSYNVPT